MVMFKVESAHPNVVLDNMESQFMTLEVRFLHQLAQLAIQDVMNVQEEMALQTVYPVKLGTICILAQQL